jgi:hypothetical protein
MFAPTNPENETRRAEAILRSFTEYEEVAHVFAGDQNYDQFELVERAPKGKRTTQVSKVAKPDLQPSVDDRRQQQPACC